MKRRLALVALILLAIALSAVLLRRGPEPGEAEQDSARASAPGSVMLTGSLVVEDESGARWDRESGWFRLTTWEGSGGPCYEVEVVDGAWSFEVPRGAPIGITEIVAGGKAAIPIVESDRLPIPDDEFLPVKARWAPDTVLRILASDTGEDLAGVEVVRHTEFGLYSGTHPGSYIPPDVIVRNASSPIRLPYPDVFELGARKYSVRARDHGWASIEIDRAQGGQRVLRLDSAGSLSVTLSGYDPRTPALLRMRSSPVEASGSPFLDLLLGREPQVSIDSVPAGTYEVSVELGAWHQREQLIVLGSDEVTVAPGRRSELSIDLAAAPHVVPVPLMGTVVVPPEWEEDFMVAATLIDPLLIEGHERSYVRFDDLEPLEEVGAYRWNAGLVQPGRYRVSVVPLPHEMVIDVGEDGLIDARIEVPPPAKVVVRTIGDRGGDEPADSISWNRAPLHMGSYLSHSSYRVFRTADSDAFEFVAPLGAIWIELEDDVHGDRTTRVNVLPGVNEVEIVTRRSCGITVKLRDGDTALPFSDELSVTVEALEGNGWSTAWRGGFGRRSHLLPSPGFYRLSMADIEGYLPIASREVRVEVGKLAECQFNLERRP